MKKYNTDYLKSMIEFADKNPDKAAIKCKDYVITYGAMLQYANDISAALQNKRIDAGSVVAVCMDVIPEAPIISLGIWMAGCVLLPLCPEDPLTRHRMKLTSSDAKAVFAEPKYQEIFDGCEDGIAFMPIQSGCFSGDIPNAAKEIKIRSCEYSYIIYTSGTTGEPKGILNTHENLFEHFESYGEMCGLSEKSTCMGCAPMYFDCVFEEIIAPIFFGGTIVIPEAELKMDFTYLKALMDEHAVTILSAPGPILNGLNECAEKGEWSGVLKTIVTGGDILKYRDISRLLEVAEVFNGYGLSEATISSLWHKVTEADREDIPIGKPIAGKKVYLLDDHMSPVKNGEAGNIYLGGKGVALGYLNDEALTQKKFVADPFSKENGKMVDTGDMGRKREDGSILFLGRKDSQISINGVRMELTEIESAIMKYDKIKDCCLAPVKTEKMDYLSAYLLLDDSANGEFSLSELVKIFREYLPVVMLPKKFYRTDRIPRTEAGKTDIRALESMNCPLCKSAAKEDEHYSDTQRKIRDIWAGILNIEPEFISLNSNVYELGADSLQMFQIFLKMKEEFKIPITIDRFRKNDTIMLQSGIVDSLENGGEGVIQIPKAAGRQYRLTSAQKRMWILSKLENNTAVYNTLSLTRLEGELDVPRFRRALDKIMESEPVLRASFFEEEGEVYQKSVTCSEFPLVCCEMPKTANEEEFIGSYVEKEKAYHFDFEKDLLVRAYLIKCSEKNYVFLLNMSHMIVDNVSWKIFLEKLNQHYSIRQHSENRDCSNQAVNYFDYAEYEAEYLKNENIQTQLKYWTKKLQGAGSSLLDLQPYRKRPKILGIQGASKQIVLESHILNKVKALTQRERISVYAFMLSCFKIMAFIYSGQTDIITGTPVINRDADKTETMIGLFLNVLCIRDHIEPGDRVIDFAKKVHMTVQEALCNREAPFEDVVQAVNPDRKLNQSPLFQVLFDYHGNDSDIFQLEGIQITDIPVSSRWAKNEISVTLIENSGELTIDFEYNQLLYKDEFVDELLRRYKELLCKVIENPSQFLSQCRIADSRDDMAIKAYNHQAAAYKKHNRLLHEMFQEQAAATPDKTAYILDNETITYGELNAKANRMARALLCCGVKPGDIAALHFQKSFDLQALIIALIKIGAAYLPLAPEHPIRHLNNILKMAKPAYLISDVKLETEEEVQELDYSELKRNSLKEGDSNLESFGSEDSICNIIFTSASTGTPKGVKTSIKAVINRLEWEWAEFPFRKTDIMSHHKSYTLIGSIWEMFGGLLKGIPTVMIRRERVLTGMLLSDIDRYHISHLFASPPVLNSLMNERKNSAFSCDSFRFAVCSAEPVSIDFVKRWKESFGNVKLFNFYGSTEDCSDVAFFDTEKLGASDVCVPAGKPVSNTRIYILDQFDHLLPANVAGRVCVTGLPLSEGYINQEELTKKVFREMELTGKQKERVYVTGDWGYINAENNLVILGRTDHLVKVRGYLVELSDIEMELTSIPEVKQAGVIVSADGEEQKIVGFVSPQPGRNLSRQMIYDFLKERLPEYMIPSYLTILEELPATPNGKTDRLKLAEMGWDREEHTYFEAKTPMERIIQEIWENILQHSRISVYDDFFVAGGDSLKAIQLIGHIRHIFGINYPLTEFFKRANIAAMSEYITAQKGSSGSFEIEKKERQERYPLAYVQEGFWFYNKLEPMNIFYNIAANHISGKFDLELFQKALYETILRHDALRMIFREKGGVPYILIRDDAEVKIPVIDLSGLADPDKEMMRLSREEINTPFDLENGPLIRCKYFYYGANEGVILINMHHIVTDGWSINVLLKDVSDYYNAYCSSKTPVLCDLPLSYSDFILWQRDVRFGEIVERQKEYWREKLSGELPVLSLMGRKKRPRLVTYKGEVIQFEISKEQTLRLKQLGYQYNSTLFMVLMSIYYMTLYRYTKDEDIIIGSPIAGRGYPKIENVVGCFINTLCIRTACNAKMSFQDMIVEVRKNVIDAFSNSNFSFDELVHMLNPKRDVSRSPVFQCMMTMQDKPSNLFELSECQISDAGVINDLAPYDLSVIVWVEDNKTTFYVEYYSDVFTGDFIQRFFDDYRLIMERILENADEPVGEIPLLGGRQIKVILDGWNQGECLKPDKGVADKIKEYAPSDESYAIYLLDDLCRPVSEGMVGDIYLIRSADMQDFLNGRKDVLIPVGAQAYYYDNLLHLKNGDIDETAAAETSSAAFKEDHSDEVLEKVTFIWETVLNKKIEDRNRDFFSMGGNSLLLIQLLDLIEDTFHVKLSIMDLFKYTSIHQLAGYLSGIVK